MSITEGQRHELHEGLVEAIGRDRADTLMSMLPPVGWADVATKRDLVVVREEIGKDLQVLRTDVRADLADLRAEFHRDLRQQLWGILGGIWVSVLVAVVVNAITG
jgi:hypothetical protein